MHYSDPPSPSLELNSLSDPDLPLIRPTFTQPRSLDRLPKWLLPRQSRLHQLISAIRSRMRPLFALLEPRLSWRYIFFSTATIYVLTCLLFQKPPFASPLPAYTGPHAVGTIDLEIPLQTPRLISKTIFRTSGLPAFNLQTVLFTLYYPVDKGYVSSYPKHYWIPRPISLTARGFVKFAHMDYFFIRPVFTFALWALAGCITIPAEVDAPLVSSQDRLPLMVFSHGMASSRTDYTNYLGELASRGYIVAAIEHRDGSSPGLLVKTGTEIREVLHFGQNDLLLSNNSAISTPQLKIDQLAFRDSEILETISVMQSINANKSVTSSRSEGKSLPTFAQRIDFSKLMIGGHSYGATGALQALKNAPSASNPAVGGIILDPGKESGPLNAEINVPILVVNSNSWSKTHSLFFGRPHFSTVRDLVKDALKRNGASWFLTSLGTSHPSVTDAPLLEPLLLSWTTGTTLDTKEALMEYVRVSDDFFQFIMGEKARGVLVEEVTHNEYGKWVSDERKASYPEDLARLWEVHISPASDDTHSA